MSTGERTVDSPFSERPRTKNSSVQDNHYFHVPPLPPHPFMSPPNAPPTNFYPPGVQHLLSPPGGPPGQPPSSDFPPPPGPGDLPPPPGEGEEGLPSPPSSSFARCIILPGTDIDRLTYLESELLDARQVH